MLIHSNESKTFELKYYLLTCSNGLLHAVFISSYCYPLIFGK